MTKQHTPGPWKVYLADNGKIIGIGVDRPGDEDHGAGVTDPRFGLWGDEDEKNANAHLIAAAPDLLDALENLTIAVAMGWDLDGVLDVSRAAIARATGAK